MERLELEAEEVEEANHAVDHGGRAGDNFMLEKTGFNLLTENVLSLESPNICPVRLLITL